MKLNELKKFVKHVVRETIEERELNMNEAGLTSEVLPSGFGPGERHYKVTQKVMRQYGKDAPETYATINKIKKGMDEGIIDEASYKVVSPSQIRTQNCDHARTIQTEPTVTETAYKTQGPSAKTFKDSPQFPKALNDPKNA